MIDEASYAMDKVTEIYVSIACVTAILEAASYLIHLYVIFFPLDRELNL